MDYAKTYVARICRNASLSQADSKIDRINYRVIISNVVTVLIIGASKLAGSIE